MKVFIPLWLLLLCLCVCSCRTQQWYGKQITIANYKYPGLTAGFCAGAFPIKSDTSLKYISITDTIIQPGETILVDCDSVVRSLTPRISGIGGAQLSANIKSANVIIKCPPTKIINTRDSIITTITQENTAGIKSLEIKVKSEVKRGDNWRLVSLICIPLIIILFLMLFLVIRNGVKLQK